MSLSYKNSPMRGPPTTFSSSANRENREQCFLCDLPRMPWTLLRDFSEIVCRGCVNYEGSDRVEIIIEQAKHLKTNYSSDSAAVKQANRMYKGFTNSPIKPPLTPQDKVPTTPVSSCAPDFSLHKDVVASLGAMQFQRDTKPSPGIPPAGFMDFAARGFGGVSSHSILAPGGSASNGAPPLMSPAASLAYRQGMIAARIAAASNWTQTQQKLSSSASSSAMSEESSSPGTPIEEYRPLTTPLNLDYSSKPPHVVQALQTLARATPFEVRFKKAHSERGRVFAVDASLKTGTDYDLKLYIEYPLGSGQVYTSASGVAKQMCKNSLREMSRPLSSGFKYLEYEVQPDKGDWRLIGDFLPESVRSFKESVKEDLIPTPRIDPNFPSLPKFSINLSIDTINKNYGDSNNNNSCTSNTNVPSSPMSGKRKALSDMDISGFPSSKRLSIDSPIARRPTSLTLTMPSPTPTHHSMKSPMNLTSSLAPPTPTNGFSLTSPQRSPHNIRRQSSTTPPDFDIMKCFLCCAQLEDTHFVQCPAVHEHKFCFPCSKDSIKQQGVKSEVFCPSGKRCRLSSSKTVPWAFMPGEITQILSMQVAPKYRYDRISNSQSAEVRSDKSISP